MCQLKINHQFDFKFRVNVALGFLFSDLSLLTINEKMVFLSRQ